jgi:hypothetical protein
MKSMTPHGITGLERVKPNSDQNYKNGFEFLKHWPFVMSYDQIGTRFNFGYPELYHNSIVINSNAVF